jgi:hypothetical protein
MRSEGLQVEMAREPLYPLTQSIAVTALRPGVTRVNPETPGSPETPG